MIPFPNFFARSFFTLNLIILLGAPAWPGALDDGVAALMRNHIEEAAEHFQQAKPQNSERAWQGLLVCAWVRGSHPEMASALQALIENHHDSPYLPTYLAFLGSPELQGWPLKERLQSLRKAFTESSSAAHRQHLAVELAETLDMNMGDEVEPFARRGGILLDHWQVLGLFGEHGASDLHTRFAPETELRESYEGWQRQAAFQPVTTPDQTGLIEFEPWVGPNEGVAYAFNVIEAQEEGTARLTVQSPANFRVWWNGEPLYEKNENQLHTAHAVSANVSIKPGRQLLVIKSQQGGGWWVRARLQAVEDEAVAWQSVPFQKEDFPNYFLKPFSGVERQDATGAGLTSTYPFALPQPESDGQAVLQDLLQTIWHTDRNAFLTARQLAQQAAERVDTFALPHAVAGDLALRLANQRPGSQSRFHQEAEAALQKALDLYPLTRSAVLNLLSYYLERNQTDTAYKFFRNYLNEHPAIKNTGYNGMVNYQQALLYRRKNFNTDAAELLQEAVQGYLPSYQAFVHLAQFYRQNNRVDRAVEVVQQALDVFPAYPPYIDQAIEMQGLHPDVPDPEPFIERMLKIHPNSLGFARAKAKLLEAQGNRAEAMAYYETMKQRFPRHRRQWSRQQADLAFIQGDRRKALEEYRRIYAQDPGNARAFRVLRDVAERPDFPYMRYDVTLDDVNLDDLKQWEDSRANAIYVLDMMVQEYHEDGTYSSYVHQAVQIQNQQGIDDWSEIVIPSGNVEILQARTITPEGNEWPVANVQNLNNRMALSMYGVEPGAIVEYAYLQHGGSNDPGQNFHSGGYYFAADNDPMLLSKLTIVKPKSLPLHLDIHPADFKPEISQRGDKEIYQWENRSQDGLKVENFSPPISLRAPTVHWSTAKDFNLLLARYEQTLWGFEEDSPLIRTQAKTLLEEAANKTDYVKTVYTWIRDTIETSSGGQTTVDTLALQAGGPFQKLRLARQLLRLGKINSHLALAFSPKSDQGYGPLPGGSIGGDASFVLIVPKQDGIEQRVVFDFRSRFMPYDRIDPSLRRHVALVIDGSASYLEPLDPSVWRVGILDKTLDVAVHENGSASLSGTYVFENLYDLQIRQALTNPEVRQRFANQQLSRDFRGIRLQSHALEDIDNLSQYPRLEFLGMLPDFAQQKGDARWTIQPIKDKSQAAARFLTGSERQYPIEFDSAPLYAPLTTRLDLGFYLQNGATVNVPDDTFILSPFGAYALTSEWQGSELVICRTFLVYQQTISPGKYKEFVEFCRSIDQAEEYTISIHNLNF